MWIEYSPLPFYTGYISVNTMKTHIESPRLILREWDTKKDLEPFARMNADPLVMQYLPRVLNENASARHIKEFQEHFKKHGFGFYVLEKKDDGEFVGFVGIEHVDFKANFTPAIQLAWRLDYEYWGQGYASEAAKAVIEHAFNELNIKELVAFSVHDNERILHIFEKLGLKYQENEDFDYPALKKGHPLGRFVLYKIKKDK